MKTGQNIKYDSLILKKHGIEIKGLDFDTMIAAHLINPIAKSISLDALSIEYLNYEMIPITELIGKGKNQTTMDKVPIEKVAFYAMEDSDIAFQLTQVLKDKLKKIRLFDYFTKIEMPLLNVLIQMEFTGTFVDSKLLKTMSNDIGKKIKSITSSIFALSGKILILIQLNNWQQFYLIILIYLK